MRRRRGARLTYDSTNSKLRETSLVTQARQFTTRPEIQGTFGVVASTHWIASSVGMSILERGGNAFDAGVATAFTLQVVEPHLNGPGGDVPVMVWDKRHGKAEVICGQGVAPAAATIAHYKGLGLDLAPGTGLLAAVVPGAFSTWMLVLERHGTMRLRDVLSPAIGYARNGYPVVHQISETIATVADLFREHWPTSAAVYLPGNKVPAPGSVFKNPGMADTYARILKEAEAGGGGREAEIARAKRTWSEGFVAEAIDRFCRDTEVMDVSGRRNRGVLTGQDMARWKPGVEAPLALDYGRYRVLKPGPWSQAPVLLQQLALLKGHDLGGMSPTDPDFLHLWVETAKLAFADREAFYGDPDFSDVPMAEMLSEPYNAARAKLIDMGRASMEQRPGAPGGRTGAVQARLASGSPLPSWLSFDGVSGQFSGIPPEGMREAIDLEVIAKDTEGREARAIFRLVVGEVPVAEGEAARSSWASSSSSALGRSMHRAV